ncbi:restriction endonuclease subunit S [Gluconacetobacter sp.]|uniref:restriction endonuclease subunit S n=1 Tax=Gluconacetobacter sp. TaxID=1935994 RepID=UPI0039E7E62D
MLPKGWAKADFEEIFDFKGGSQPPKSDFSSEKKHNYVRLLQIRDFESDEKAVYIKDLSKWPKCSAEDIMIGRYGASVGKILSGKAGAYNVALVKMIFDSNKIDRKWVKKFLESTHFQEPLKEISRSAQNGFNKNDVKKIHVLLPPLAEQRRIVAKLNSLTTRIARARAELERVRTLSFRAWKSVINQSFQKFKCDNVPLKQIAQITGGLTKNTKRSSLPLQVPYLRVANVYANELRLSDVAEIGCSEKEYKKTKLERNDLLIVEGNGSIDQVGRAARWNGEIDGCTHQNHLIRIRPYESMSSDFLLFFLESSPGRKYIETSASSTSGLHTLSISKIGNFLCPLPSRLLQDATVKYLNLCRDRLSKKRIEIDRALALLDRLEASLLANAFRGELVPQDPNDEPASVLLDRIRAERAAAPKPKRRRKA